MVDIEILSSCLENAGVYADICNTENDLDLRDFVESSLQFIAIIVAIEEAFSIEIPDEYLVIDNFASLRNLITIIDQLMQCKE